MSYDLKRDVITPYIQKQGFAVPADGYDVSIQLDDQVVELPGNEDWSNFVEAFADAVNARVVVDFKSESLHYFFEWDHESRSLECVATEGWF